MPPFPTFTVMLFLNVSQVTQEHGERKVTLEEEELLEIRGIREKVDLRGNRVSRVFLVSKDLKAAREFQGPSIAGKLVRGNMTHFNNTDY